MPVPAGNRGIFYVWQEIDFPPPVCQVLRFVYVRSTQKGQNKRIERIELSDGFVSEAVLRHPAQVHTCGNWAQDLWPRSLHATQKPGLRRQNLHDLRSAALKILDTPHSIKLEPHQHLYVPLCDEMGEPKVWDIPPSQTELLLPMLDGLFGRSAKGDTSFEACAAMLRERGVGISESNLRKILRSSGICPQSSDKGRK
jgi:hypothetical protein